MQESTLYRSIQQEAQIEKSRSGALNLLRGSVDVNLIASSTGLWIAKVQQLLQTPSQVAQN